MLEGFKSPRSKKVKIEDIIQKYPRHFSVEEIVDAELPKAKSEVREDLASLLNEYFEKEIIEKEKSEMKKEIAMIKEWEEFKKEKRREEQENVKEEKLKILEELKEMLDDALVEEQKSLHLYEHYVQRNNWSFWVGFAAHILSKTYFKKINKKASKREIANLKEEIKREYYAKKYPKENFSSKPSHPIRNFYESQREQREDLEDDDY
ncbi:hypothetical protein SDC9_07890 [bioreactor metagenome]|uniref:Uncharacterized protein n=1 Tax=bioreactor metagenome TaxID=1076179 RepID=A0A644T675_9ZZZZ|nr:hypothetical protein [Candidatus Elulimicrobiales bacterium]